MKMTGFQPVLFPNKLCCYPFQAAYRLCNAGLVNQWCWSDRTLCALYIASQPNSVWR